MLPDGVWPVVSIGLPVALVVVLAFCTWRVLRAGIRLLRALGDLVLVTAKLDAVDPWASVERPAPAISTPFAELIGRRKAVADRRKLRKRRRLARGRLLLRHGSTRRM